MEKKLNYNELNHIRPTLKEYLPIEQIQLLELQRELQATKYEKEMLEFLMQMI